MASALKLGIVQQTKPDSLGVRHSLDAILKVVREAPAQDLPDLIGQLESIKAVAWARLVAPTLTPQANDELIDVSEAASRLGVSADYLYRNHSRLPFTRRAGRKLLFAVKGIEQYISQKKRL